jgi:uncharacterized protein DUF4234
MATETRPAASADGRPLGRRRGVAFVIVLSIVTLGIYHLYWIFKTFQEVKGYRGQGVGGLVGLVLSILLVGLFLLPSYIGRMFSESRDVLERRPPVSGWSGLWILVPYVGPFIWLAKLQIWLNNFWKAAGAAAVAEAATG